MDFFAAQNPAECEGDDQAGELRVPFEGRTVDIYVERMHQINGRGQTLPGLTNRLALSIRVRHYSLVLAQEDKDGAGVLGPSIEPAVWLQQQYATGTFDVTITKLLKAARKETKQRAAA